MKRLALLLMLAATIALALSVQPTQAAVLSPATCHLLPAEEAMPETVRQQLVDKVILRLARIKTDNGFQTDIGASLATDKAKEEADWPTHQQEELIGTGRFAVHDRDNDIEWTDTHGKTPSVARNSLNTLGLQVRWYHKSEATPAELRRGIGDIQRAIITHEVTGAREPTFADWNEDDGKFEKPLLMSLKPERDGFVVPPETFQIDACAVEFTAVYVTQAFNSYV